MKILIIFLMILLCGCSPNTSENPILSCDINADGYNDNIYIKGEYLLAEYGRSGYVKKVPIDDDILKVDAKFITKDCYLEIILIGENSAFVYDFAKVPTEINHGQNYTFSLKPTEKGSLLAITPNGQSFVAGSGYKGLFSISKPYNFKVSDVDNDGSSEILFSYKIKDDDKDILILNCIEKYYNGFWHINEINYEIL